MLKIKKRTKNHLISFFVFVFVSYLYPFWYQVPCPALKIPAMTMIMIVT